MEPTSMDAQAVLHELTYAEGLPREALKAASAQRGEMVSLFLEEIETYLALEPGARVKPTPLFFTFHLLGEWREKAAYRLLARLLRLPGPEIDRIFGDGITTTSHRVMAAVFDGDPQPLYDIILDPNAEEFIRAGMYKALAMVTLRGELDRAVAGRFLRDAFVEIRPQAECYVWVGWQSAIAALGMSDLKILVKRAFDRGFIDSDVLGVRLLREGSQTGNRASWRSPSSWRSPLRAIRRHHRRVIRVVLFHRAIPGRSGAVATTGRGQSRSQPKP
jgi:Protein of unknown function (DUF1186)